MSTEELIGRWTLQHKAASQRYQRVRSELSMFADTFDRLSEALTLDDLTNAEALCATANIPTVGQLKALIIDANVARTQRERAKRELVSLDINLAD